MANNIRKAKAKDGATYDFVIKPDPPSGAMKYVYSSPNKDYVIAFYRYRPDARAMARLESITEKYRHDIFDQIDGDYWKQLFCWPEKLVEWEGKLGIVVPTVAQDFFFKKDPKRIGLEKEGKWFASARLLRTVAEEERGNFLNFLKISLKLSQAVRRMHASGLALSDLSYKSVLIDPSEGNACFFNIIDELIVPGENPPGILGTPDFIAPEVLTTQSLPEGKRVLPSRTTDLHALAVLIYMYLLHRHPLRGGRYFGPDVDNEETLLMGSQPLYIEDPTDRSNRNMKREYGQDNYSKYLPWVDLDNFSAAKITGPFLASLFERAFIDGLKNPMRRPLADEWERAIIKTMDCLQPCSNLSCPGKWYVFDGSKHPRCPFCGMEYKGLLPKPEFYSSNQKRQETKELIMSPATLTYILHCNACGVHGEIDEFTETFTCPQCQGEMRLFEVRISGDDSLIEALLEQLIDSAERGDVISKRTLAFLLDSPNEHTRTTVENVLYRKQHFQKETSDSSSGDNASYGGKKENADVEFPDEEYRLPGTALLDSHSEEIEAQTRTTRIVYLRPLLESATWLESRADIPILLGRHSMGKVAMFDLAKAPHLLIAGSTGSGKSVCMNSLILSLLFRFSPDDLKLVMIDPNIIDFEVYRPIPHLITPVVNAPRKAPLALRWTVNEMERRRMLLAKVRARNLAAFNSRPPDPHPVFDDFGYPVPPKLPILVVIINELSDLMMSDQKKDVEQSIFRLTQKGHDAGIHLVMMTSALRKDVVTDHIKSNIRSRIMLRVSDAMSSRVIMDRIGAEKLLGNGDMLFFSSQADSPERIQGAYVSDREIEKVVDEVAAQRPQMFDDGIFMGDDEDEDEEYNGRRNKGKASGGVSSNDGYDDEMDDYDEIDGMANSDVIKAAANKYLLPGDPPIMIRALAIIINEQQVSTSYLQRRLGIGYNKAADLLDVFEARHIISAPLPGGQKRTILITDDLRSS